MGASTSTSAELDDFLGLGKGNYSVEKRSFHDSNFHDVYVATPKRPEDRMVMDGLRKLKKQKFYKFYTTNAKVLEFDEEKGAESHEIATKKCGYCWTVQTPKFYGELKTMLINDDPKQLAHWMPFIRALNRMLVCQSVDAMTCYRGTQLKLHEFKRFQRGFTYRIPYFVATTTDRTVAEGWGGANYYLHLKVPKNCPNIGSMGELSKYKHEKEMLLPPYTAFHVEDKDETSMTLLVLDNLKVDTKTNAYLVHVTEGGVSMLYKCAGIAGAGCAGAAAGAAVGAAMGPGGAAAGAVYGGISALLIGFLMSELVAVLILSSIQNQSVAGVGVTSAVAIKNKEAEEKYAALGHSAKFID